MTRSNTVREPRLGLPDLGCGVGLRIPHYAHMFDAKPAVDFLEIISENFMLEGGLPLANLDRALGDYRVVQHGVSLGIGASTPLDWDYLRRLKALTKRTQTPWLTDHLCWTRVPGAELHDLLPLPYTDEAIRHVTERVRIVQDFLELRVGLENTSSYLTYRQSTLTEWDFLSAIVEEADCGILLDVNNVHVSAYNHGFDARTFVASLPHHRVLQMHLAGHTNKGAYLLDTHSDVVAEAVWDLYRHAISMTGDVSTLVEWDADLPDFETLWGQAKRAAAIRDEVRQARSGGDREGDAA